MRLAAIAAIATAAPLWLLVPHVPLAVVVVALAICGASIPLINAPYLGMLSVARAARAARQGAAVADHDQPARRAARLPDRRDAVRRSRPALARTRSSPRSRPSRAAQLHPAVCTESAVLPKKRLDVLLVERGLAESRAQAQALVMAGRVPGHSKPGEQVDDDAPLEVERAAAVRLARRTQARERTRRVRDRRRRASTASTSARRPAASPTCCCSAARRA